MAILVTGGAGYVGFNVVEALLKTDRRVVLFDRGQLPEMAQRALAPYGQQIAVVTGDVCDFGTVSNVFQQNAIDGVIHCAAVTPGPDRESRDPGRIAEVNLGGTINVLNAARRGNVRRVVYTSSSMVYGESLFRLPRLYEDHSPAIPVTLYGITKHAAERMCLRLRELWSLDVICARLGTVVGPWERNTGVRDSFGTHSQLALSAAIGKPAILPHRAVRRDWVYSRDVAAGLVTLLDARAPQHVLYNLSSGQDWGSAALDWCDALKTVYPDFQFRVAAEGEIPNVTYTDRDRFPMDVGRMVNEFGFRPRGPDAAYTDYIEWIKHTSEFWQL